MWAVGLRVFGDKSLRRWEVVDAAQASAVDTAVEAPPLHMVRLNGHTRRLVATQEVSWCVVAGVVDAVVRVVDVVASMVGAAAEEDVAGMDWAAVAAHLGLQEDA